MGRGIKEGEGANNKSPLLLQHHVVPATLADSRDGLQRNLRVFVVVLGQDGMVPKAGATYIG